MLQQKAVAAASLPLKRCLALAAAAVTSPASLGRPSHHVFDPRVEPVYFNVSEAEVTRLQSGLIVASVDNLKDLSHIALTFNAGTRFESTSTLGMTQRIRSSFGLGNTAIPIFEIGPMQGMLGCKLESNYNREHIWLSTSCVRDNVADTVEFLGSVATPTFMDHLLTDRAIDIDAEIKHTVASHPGYLLLDLLHEAAFGSTGLGNPLVQHDGSARKHGITAIEGYAAENLVSGRAGLIGLGVDHQLLSNYADKILQLPEAAGAPLVKSVYRGGEERHAVNQPFTFVAIAAEGVSIQDTAGTAAQLLLSRMLYPGEESGISRSSALGDAISAAGLEHVGVSIINASYTDSGLFGIQFSCLPSDVEKVCKTCMLAFRELSRKGISEEDFNAIKKQELINLMLSDQSDHDLIEHIARNVLSTGFANAPYELASAVQNATLADVQAAAKSLVGKKLSMAAVGNLENTPYLVDLAVA